MLVTVTELRQHLPAYLEAASQGEPIQVSVHGEVIARLIRESDAKMLAQQRLAHAKCVIHDIISPTNEVWEAEDAD